ncbi:MAG TPA: acyl-CoA dehydrogenase family protein [Acidimicrobiales bacterium]|nr:acyl-CoA dehydrogenase family protein [Acidimicrobiales bacterium]
MDLSMSGEELAFRDEIRAWLEANVDVPERFASLEEEFAWGREWQARLAADRWVGIHWPEEYGGRGATPLQLAIFNLEYARSRAPQPVNRNGINHVGPTLLAHGTESQKARFLPPILDAREIWCQLFSEPGAGSDLASLTTRAIETEGGWVLQGQKVWTSYAQFARWGIALVRTDPDLPKHRGLSYLVVDMTSPGVEIRPLVTITGESEFNEVFLDEVFVPTDCLVGERNRGWAVANTTLAHERGTFPFKEEVVHGVYLEELYRLAEELGTIDDPDVADALAAAAVKLRVLRLANLRTLTKLAKGEELGPESSVVKLTWSDMTQTMSDAALSVVSAAAPLWEGASANPGGGTWQRQWLWSKAATIAGGTSEVQRTVIGDRILGLPR